MADLVIQNAQTTLVATIGAFAMLVLADFTGPPRTRFVAYLALACVGTVLVVLGTVCSQNAWLAAGAMAVVGFVVLFVGVLNGYLAAAATATLLAFVLPVTIPVPLSDLPARLLGWVFAAIASISAQMLLWPPPERDAPRRDTARATRALADLADAELAGDPARISDQADVARAAVDGLRQRFVATPRRPTGPTGRAAALASLVDELGWLQGILMPGPGSVAIVWSREATSAELMQAAVAVLRASATRLEGSDERIDVSRLDATREAAVDGLTQTISELPNIPEAEAFETMLEPAFRAQAISASARQVARHALLASGATAPEERQGEWVRGMTIGRAGGSWPHAAGRLLAEHVNTRSAWFRNSVRGAIGLAIAVFVALQGDLQHGFWVALGTLSVLRSSALGTGSSILWALVGTTVGILGGAALIIAIGSYEPLLWALFPVATLFAGYATRSLPFVFGQAAFTVVVLILFNLIQPAGSSLGLVRIEDVAIGCAVSFGVGVLFWPRGASALLRESLASAYALSADYVANATRQLVHDGVSGRGDGVAKAAGAAIERLDDTFRESLAERMPGRANIERAAPLVDGAERVRRAGASITALRPATAGDLSLQGCGGNLDREVDAFHAWYVQLGDAIVEAAAIPPPHVRDLDGRAQMLDCVRAAIAQRERAKTDSALALLWMSRYLDRLWRLESHLGQEAAPPWNPVATRE